MRIFVEAVAILSKAYSHGVNVSYCTLNEIGHCHARAGGHFRAQALPGKDGVGAYSTHRGLRAQCFFSGFFQYFFSITYYLLKWSIIRVLRLKIIQYNQRLFQD